jgi:hypothetical protein
VDAGWAALCGQRPALSNLASEMKRVYALVQQLQRKCKLVTAREKQLNARVGSDRKSPQGAPVRALRWQKREGVCESDGVR